MEAEQKDDTIFVPYVTIGAILKIGKEFQSHEDAYDFYNKYAKLVGFSTCIANSKKNKETREVVWKMFVCSNEGKTDESWHNKRKKDVVRSGERNRGHTRCDCQAKMNIKKSQDGKVWTISFIIEQHNHALATPSKVHLLQSQRNVSATNKTLAQQFFEANISTCQQVRLLEIDARGPSMIGCMERDIRNHKRDIKCEQFGHDAETLLQHFELEKERNENFYFVYETDNTGIFIRCFWAYHESRRSYECFGKTVVFDTTYNTNKYSMVFAPFVGVNHLRQTTIFRCGLLSDEKTKSFNWLFSKFLECMSNHNLPNVIITNQDAAISQAIKKVFLGTLHRFCLWHILNKFSEKLNALLYRDQYHKLASIIKETESAEKFENHWLKLMTSTELGNNEWLSNIYVIQNQWLPTYVRYVFAAGISSSQRIQSNHFFFKRYVNHKNSLADFITRFNRALIHQRHDELVANHIDSSKVPRLVTGFLMEQQVSSIYTTTVFLLFQKELKQSMTYICTLISSTCSTSVYKVKQFDLGEIFSQQCELIYDTSSDLISGSCRLFEFEGYPCRHMLCWMKVTQVKILPDKYIIPRWTKKEKYVVVHEPTPNFVGLSLISRRGILTHMAMELVDDCSLIERRRELQKLKIRVKDIDDEGNIGKHKNISKSRERAQIIQDPLSVQAKGCDK